jgi:hypothetical protein
LPPDANESAPKSGVFVPDVTPSSPGLVDILPDGTRRLIVAGMRILDHPDGSLERAREILPNGTARVVTLPSRIGGGLLIYIGVGGTTQLWRAKSWLDPLVPLSEIRGAVTEIVSGFDRLYAQTGGDIKAIDPVSGRQLPLGVLPPATRIGLLAFADAWRAVAVVDYRGALATFDAGNSWRPIPLDGTSVTQLWTREGDFVLETARGRLVLGSNGELSKDEPSRDAPRAERALGRPADDRERGGPASDRSSSLPASADPRGLGRRPLRAAIEDGWPLGEDAALFAQAGVLYRVALPTGKILDSRAGAFREADETCHAVPLGRTFGFVCGAAGGETSIYGFEYPLEMREIVRFAHPRMVIPSGNGGFVVRGGCARDASSASGRSDAFCFFSPSGAEREVKSPGADARENTQLRPVMLHDGRPLFVVPPSEGSNGKLLVWSSSGFATVPLSLDDSQSTLRRANLLEGIEEREGVLGAWALVGAELRGVRIGLDGKVSVGRGSANIERTAVSGRHALDWGKVGSGLETRDGGMNWSQVELPSTDLPRPSRAVAACGPVGCAEGPKGTELLGGAWLRVGWGTQPHDLLAAPTPKPSRVALAPARGIALKCEPTGEIAGPVPKPPVKPPPTRAATKPGVAKQAVKGLSLDPITGQASAVWGPAPAPFPAKLAPAMGRPATPPTPPSRVTPPSTGVVSTWSAFRGLAPPTLASGDVGLEAGTDPPVIMQARIYAWGARGAEWVRTGHVQARFDDRFDLSGVRLTAISSPPWADEDRAGDALGLTAGQAINWSALLDVSGQSAVIIGQRGSGRAELYAATQGEPLVAWKDSDDAPLPIPSTVVRIGPTWFFLAPAMVANAWAATIYRVDHGVVRSLARLPRIPVPSGEFAPKLMRRAQSDGLAILVWGAPGFDQMIRDWYALPVDTDTGELEEPIRLFGSDLEGQIPPRCMDDRDGWMVSTDLSLAPAVRVTSPPSANISTIELRLRIDPGTICVDALAARADGLLTPAHPVHRSHAAPDADSELPLAATDPSSGRRWMLRCGP